MIRLQIEEKKIQNQTSHDRARKLEQTIDHFHEKAETQKKYNVELLDRGKSFEFEIATQRSKIKELQFLLHSTVNQYEQQSSAINTTIEKLHSEIEDVMTLNTENTVTKELIDYKKRWKSTYFTQFQKYEQRKTLLLEEIRHQQKLMKTIETEKNNIPPSTATTTYTGDNDLSAKHPSSLELEPANNRITQMPNSETRSSRVDGTISIHSSDYMNPTQTNPLHTNQPWFREFRKRKFPLENQTIHPTSRFSNGLEMLHNDQHNVEN